MFFVCHKQKCVCQKINVRFLHVFCAKSVTFSDFGFDKGWHKSGGFGEKSRKIRKKTKTFLRSLGHIGSLFLKTSKMDRNFLRGQGG